MANTIRVRASAKGGVTEVKALITHPMETGQRKDKKTGQAIPAHFIQEVPRLRARLAVSDSEMVPLALSTVRGRARPKTARSIRRFQGGKRSLMRPKGHDEA